jgi:c-di-GMP-binding flagellar brake protein YcgR
MFGLKKQQDMRSYPRWRLDRFLAVYDEDKSTFLGRVLDLSVSGMCVLSSETLPIGNHVKFAIELLEDSGVRTFYLGCRSLWLKPDGNDGLYRMGLEFSDVSPAVIEEIERIICEQNLARSAALRPSSSVPPP